MEPLQQKRALILIFLTLLIDCIGFGVIIPVTPGLIKELLNSDISEAARYGGYLTFMYAAMQFLCAPILGGLSDRYGRRPVLLAALLGLGLDFLILYYAPTFTWLVIGRLLAGIAGASFSPASAYLADISTNENRAQNFGLIGAAFGLGFILGPVIGGVVGEYGTRLPFLLAAGLSLTNATLAYFFLPESLPSEHRRSFDLKRSNPFNIVNQIKRYPQINGLLLATALIYVASHAMQSTWSYYTMELFHWSKAQVGYSLGVVGLSVAIVQGGLIRVLLPKIGNQKAILSGLLLYVLAFLAYSFVPADMGWLAYALILPYCLSGIAGPAIQGYVSQFVQPNERGEMQGIFASTMSFTGIVGPLLMTNLFSYFTDAASHEGHYYFPGVPYLAGSVLTFAAFWVAFRFLKNKNLPEAGY